MSGNNIVANLSVDISVFLGCPGWCPVIFPLWLLITVLKFGPSLLFFILGNPLCRWFPCWLCLRLTTCHVAEETTYPQSKFWPSNAEWGLYMQFYEDCSVKMKVQFGVAVKGILSSQHGTGSSSA